MQWSATWQLEFNIDKGKILHVGYKNPETSYNMTPSAGLKEITVTEVEKDLGILLDNDLRFHKQVATTVKAAIQILGMIKRTFTHFDGQL